MQINQERVTNLFQKTKDAYPQLKNTPIVLQFKKERFFTMRATIKLRSFFNKQRNYVVVINTRRAETLFPQLSDSDIVGWIAHELAHIIDYETMSNTRFIFFVLRYLFDLSFRSRVEKRTNVFTVNHGFAKELFGVWKKFLSLEIINKRYKKYIITYYRPRWDDIQQAAKAQGITKEDFDSFFDKESNPSYRPKL